MRQRGVKGPGGYQNTNAPIESYHSNFKNILNFVKEQFVGRRMDWLIYHLTRDMLTHYWYGVQCKVFGFVRNQKHEGIICSTTIQASAISKGAFTVGVLLLGQRT